MEEKKTIAGWMMFLHVRPAIHDEVLYADETLYTETEFLEKVPYDTHVPFNEPAELKPTLEDDVDRLAQIRGIKKELEAEEKILKEKMLNDGRSEIPGRNFKVVITERATETFNEEAFIETFKNDNKFDDELKSKILASKLIVDQAQLLEACQKEIIPLDYVVPFNKLKKSKVVNIK